MEFPVERFDLRLTMESGQFFRYRKNGECYHVQTAGHALVLAQDGPIVHFSGADEGFVRSLLGLDERNEEWFSLVSRDPVLSPLAVKYRGLRIMRTDLHETILGFICSANANIPKIMRNVELLSRGGLPPPGTALPEALAREAGTGYRARYLAATNEMLTPAFLQELERADYLTARDMLLELPGVGPKVADCICLFGLGHGESFPVDVHVRRALDRLFPGTNDPAGFARARWSSAAGLAQQLLFLWSREAAA